MSVDKTLKSIVKKLDAIDNRLTGVEKNMATRSDLANVRKEMATKSDIEKSEKRTKEYVNEVAQEILSAVSDHDDNINNRLDKMELKFVTRDEFEALKRKVDRYHSN